MGVQRLHEIGILRYISAGKWFSMMKLFSPLFVIVSAMHRASCMQ